MPANEQILTAIVEDDRATREGLSLLINGTPGYRCVGAYRSVEDALRANTDGLDVLLLDINLPGMLGSDGVRFFKQKSPHDICRAGFSF
jgi:DNA-binding NarL/FixJ family response regulator